MDILVLASEELSFLSLSDVYLDTFTWSGSNTALARLYPFFGTTQADTETFMGQ